jgi:hypothetical protein
VTRLKEQISARRYRVDSQAVAREMVFKLRMLAMLRESATTPAGFGAKALTEQIFPTAPASFGAKAPHRTDLPNGTSQFRG